MMVIEELTDENRHATMVISQLPVRWRNFAKRLQDLKDGRYILTITINGDRVFWTVQQMNKVEQ